MPQTDDPFYSSPTLDGGATDEDSFEATWGAGEGISIGEIRLKMGQFTLKKLKGMGILGVF